ncbi:hypothetical protein [Duganella radicis]|uniref:Pilus assembly protein n=1 Tax=Duganella radicis TaxID=551988 RepID=A0A6L6PNN0_9BURK|nr:hypothetical protein [Duganella radicis]MTV40583.1 hypothetical protein [Duganella radicis]
MRTLVILLAALLTACANSPRLDREFGSSVRAARAQQTLNPQAGRESPPRPVNGLDAQAAAGAYQNYQQSFITKDDQSNNFTIGGRR